MARMYPSRPSPGTNSDAEKYIFGRLRDELPDSWIVLHSLGLTKHTSKPWAEIDFVVIGPLGVTCLEVKGGRVERESGDWIFINRHGHRNKKPEGPFEQVGSAAPALYNWMKTEAPWTRSVMVGYGVIIPNAQFTVSGPDILSEVLYDARDVANGLNLHEYLENVATYWHERLGYPHSRPPRLLHDREIQRLRELLRRDFDLIPTPAVTSKGVNHNLIRLTDEQRQVLINLADNARLWVTGGAGSGKTLLAMDEVRRASSCGQRVLYLCFNKRLARAQAANVSHLKNIKCIHLHGLLTEIVRQHQGSIPRPDVDDEYYFREWLPRKALDTILLQGPAFDVIVVDEGQDLMLPAYVDLVDALLEGGLSTGSWRWFSDPAQNLFGATSIEAVRRLKSASPALFRLTINCRNTHPIFASAHLISGVDMREVADTEGPEVEMIWFGDRSQARRDVSRHVAHLISGGIKPEEVIVLSRRHLDNSIMRNGFDPIVPYPLVESPEPPFGIEFATVQSYKGLEAEAVVLIDVDGFDTTPGLADLYAGATRARSHLAIAIDERHRQGYEQMARQFGEALVRANS